MIEDKDYIEGIIFLKVIYKSSIIENKKTTLKELYIALKDLKYDIINFTKIAELLIDFDLPVKEAIRLYETKKAKK